MSAPACLACGGRTDGGLVLVVPMPANAANRASGRSHWRIRHSERTRYWAQLDERQRCGLLPPPPPEPFERAVIASTMYLGNPMDDDNAMMRHKVVVDWLRTRGYLRDDRKRVLTWAGMPEQVVKRGQEYRIVLTLTPLAP